jgi:DNA-binding CsgD family transcriptional regulator
VPFEESGIRYEFLGLSSLNELVVKVSEESPVSDQEILTSHFNLTPREGEVLFWLTLGKTNRDIGDILSLSARTINKHLEMVFQKLGVDNRTVAAVLADRVLSHD